MNIGSIDVLERNNREYRARDDGGRRQKRIKGSILRTNDTYSGDKQPTRTLANRDIKTLTTTKANNGRPTT